MVAPKFEEMSLKFSTAKFIKVDVDENAAVAEKSGIRAMPTFHIYQNGVKIVEIVGANVAKLSEEIQKVVS